MSEVGFVAGVTGRALAGGGSAAGRALDAPGGASVTAGGGTTSGVGRAPGGGLAVAAPAPADPPGAAAPTADAVTLPAAAVDAELAFAITGSVIGALAASPAAAGSPCGARPNAK